MEKICCDVVDAYVDALTDSPQLLDSRDPSAHIVFSILGVSLYGKKYVSARLLSSGQVRRPTSLSNLAPLGVLMSFLTSLQVNHTNCSHSLTRHSLFLIG